MAGYSSDSPRTHDTKTHRHATDLAAKCTVFKHVRLRIFALIIRHANQIHASCIIQSITLGPRWLHSIPDLQLIR